MALTPEEEALAATQLIEGLPAEILVRVAQYLDHEDCVSLAATRTECRTAAVAAMPTALMNTVVRCCAADQMIGVAVRSRLPADLVLPDGVVKVGDVSEQTVRCHVSRQKSPVAWQIGQVRHD